MHCVESSQTSSRGGSADSDSCPRGRRVTILTSHHTSQCAAMVPTGSLSRRSVVVAACLLVLYLVGLGLCSSCKEAGLCCQGRDSSCVAQKAPINSIIEDLEDQPCYCDHACLQLGDCCPDLKQACQVADCDVSEWSSWSDCNIDCGPGVMKRSRSVIRQNHNGGKPCPALVQRRGCLGTDCPNNPRSALKETAMLLPASLAYSRQSNETDITKNLKLRYPKDQLEEQRQEYCVQFKVTKASKGCRKLHEFSALREGVISFNKGIQ